MKVLIACEFSGTVRDAFIKAGHEAMSVDLMPTEQPGPHYMGDVFDVVDYPWDLMIAHPPCTHLTSSGAGHWERKKLNGSQQAAVSFVLKLAKLDIPRIAIENPVGVLSTVWRKPDQTFHPWDFGHTEQKHTCLWLKNLPPLEPTSDLRSEAKALPRAQRERLRYVGQSKNRWKVRSQTFQGVADAMAKQWGNLNENTSP